MYCDSKESHSIISIECLQLCNGQLNSCLLIGFFFLWLSLKNQSVRRKLFEPLFFTVHNHNTTHISARKYKQAGNRKEERTQHKFLKWEGKMEMIVEERPFDETVQLLAISTPISSKKEGYMKDLDKAPLKKPRSRFPKRLSSGQITNKICKRLDFSEVEGANIQKKRIRPFMSALHCQDLAIPFSDLEMASDLEDGRDSKKIRMCDDDEVITSPVPETPTYDWKFTFASTPRLDTNMFTKLSGPSGGILNSKNLFHNLTSSPDLLKKTLKSTNTARNLNLMI